jgi:hypothetical protein
VTGCGENPETLSLVPARNGWADNRSPMFSLPVSGNSSVAGEILVFIQVSLGEMRAGALPDLAKVDRFFAPRRNLEMIRLAFEKLSARHLADELSIARRDLAPNGDNIGAAFDFESFEGIVIEIHLVRFGRNVAAIVRIVDDQIGVAPDLNRAFARE